MKIMNDRGETEFLSSHALEAEKLLMRSQGSRKKAVSTDESLEILFNCSGNLTKRHAE